MLSLGEVAADIYSKHRACVTAMHDLDPVFTRWSRSAQVAELLQDLGYKKPTPVQSMYIFKVSGLRFVSLFIDHGCTADDAREAIVFYLFHQAVVLMTPWSR